MRGLDYHFNYRHVSRFLLLHKFNNINNTHDIPKVTKIVSFFSLKRCNEIVDSSLYCYHYFFHFFFGYKASFTGFKMTYHLGTYTYTFRIQLYLSKDEVYRALLFLAHDAFIILPRYNIHSKTFLEKSFVSLFVLADLSAFTEMKTSMGLFNLKDPLNMQIFISPRNKAISNSVLNCFKVYVYNK